MRNQPTQWLLAILIEVAFTAAMAYSAGVLVAHWGGTGRDSIWVNVAGSIAGGVLGNFVYRILNLGSIFIGKLMITDQDSVHLPTNHHIARGIRGALISGVVAVAHEGVVAAKRRNPEADRSSQAMICEAIRLNHQVRRWARQERRMLMWGPAVAYTSRSVVLASWDLPDLVDPGPLNPGSEAERMTLWLQVGAAVAQELEASLGSPLPDEVKGVIEGRPMDGFSFTYLDAVSGYFMERVKKDSVLFRAANLYFMAAQSRRFRRSSWRSRPA